MKMIGLVGGISWVSSADYYRLINQGINEQLGGLDFSRCILYSFNYADIKANNDRDDWAANLKMVAAACRSLVQAGCEAILLCANTMHMIAEELRQTLPVPLIHIAEETSRVIQAAGLQKVGMLGTRFTMERDFFHQSLAAAGIEMIIPDLADREFIHYTIFEELGRGLVQPATRERYLAISRNLQQAGAQGLILGCTEIPLVLSQADLPIPVFDTLLIHTRAAVAFSLAGGGH